MDRNFLEFWGNYLLAVARGQKQMEEFSRWMQQGLQGREELTELSFRETFLQMGWVPREDYEALVEENRRLQEKLERQEERIRKLRTLLSEPVVDQTKTLQVFQNLIQKQGDEFSKLMRKLGEPEER